MQALQILAIRQQLVDEARAVLETGDLIKQIGVYPDQARELEHIYQRMMKIFSEIKWEQAE